MKYNRILKKFRKDLGLAQGDFGKKIGLNQSAIADIERGKGRISIEIAEKIKKVYDLDLLNIYEDIHKDISEMYVLKNILYEKKEYEYRSAQIKKMEPPDPKGWGIKDVK